MMDAMFIGSMHGVADSCSLNGGFRLDVANTRLSEFSVPLLPITLVQESISKRGLANEVNGSPFLCPRWKLLKTEEANGLPKLDQGRIVPNQPRFEMLSACRDVWRLPVRFSTAPKTLTLPSQTASFS